MNDFSKNKYYNDAVSGENALEIALERRMPRDEADLFVGCMVALHGFNLHLQGTRYLISLLSDYIFDDDFDSFEAIAALAAEDEVETGYVTSCILSAVEYDGKFITIASKLLEQKVEFDGRSVDELLEIIGASYKIYYNCVADDEAVTQNEIEEGEE